MNEAEKCFKSLDRTFGDIESTNFHQEFIGKMLHLLEQDFPDATVAHMIHVIVSILIHYVQEMDLETLNDEEDFAMLLIGSGFQALRDERERELHFGPSPGDG